MKKILLLLLAMVGMVSTASAKVIYLQNNWNKPNIKLYTGSTTNDGDNTCTEPANIGQWDSKTVYTLDLGDATYFRVAHDKSGDDNTGTNYFTSSDFTEGKCYYFNWNDGTSTTELIGFDITVHIYNFSVEIDPSYNLGTLRIHLFQNDTPINGDWASNPPMTKSDNVYTYTYRSIPNSGSIGVIFRNDYDQTDDMGADEGANNYVLTFNNDASKKIRSAEKVTTNSYGYCTYVNTYPLSISGATAYYATDNGNGNATAHAITNPVASTPMLIKGDASTTYYLEVVASGTPIDGTNAFHAGSGSALTSTTGDNYNYILNGDAFYAANGKKVASGKAYLQLSTATPAGARPLVFEDEEATGIATVKAIKNDIYYNLQGVKVAQPMKGLFIKNGRKVVVK